MHSIVVNIDQLEARIHNTVDMNNELSQLRAKSWERNRIFLR